MISLHEWSNRKLVAELARRGITPEQQQALTTEQWAEICTAAAVPPPPPEFLGDPRNRADPEPRT